jgi:hypothetical protein
MFLLNAVLICFLKILKCHLIIPIIDITYQMLFFPMESQLEKLAAAREGRIVERLENVCMCLWTNANASQLIESPRPIQKLVTFLRAQRRWCCVGCWTRNVQNFCAASVKVRIDSENSFLEGQSQCLLRRRIYLHDSVQLKFKYNLIFSRSSLQLVSSWVCEQSNWNLIKLLESWMLYSTLHLVFFLVPVQAGNEKIEKKFNLVPTNKSCFL